MDHLRPSPLPWSAATFGAAGVLAALFVSGCATSGLPSLPPVAASGSCIGSSCCPAGFEPIVGTPQPDRLKGSFAPDCLIGAGGADRVRGRCDADLLICGDGDDVCRGNTGPDLVLGGPGDDLVCGGWGADDVRGLEGDDELRGGRGADRLSGGRGDDRLFGRSRSDWIRGGPGRDLAEGGRGGDVFFIGAACEVEPGDTIDGGPGFDRVRSPFSLAELQAMGATFVSIEAFESVPPVYDECLEISKPWGPNPILPPGGGRYGEARVAGATVLAATGNSVFRVDAAGVAAPLGSGDVAMLSPRGDTFGLHDGSTFRVFDSSGTLLGVLGGVEPLDYVKLVPGAAIVFAAEVSGREDAGRVESVRLVRPDGSPVGSFAASGLSISRLTSDRVTYTTPSSFASRLLDGSLLWSVSEELHKLETNGSQSIAVPRFVAGQVAHYEGGTRTALEAVDGVVWNLAISPSGEFSAATTKTTLYVFRSAALTAVVPLDVAYASSVAISDRGEVLLGSQTLDRRASVDAYHWQGNLLWTETGGEERGGYRPDVSWGPDGNRFLVITESGLAAYDIERSP